MRHNVLVIGCGSIGERHLRCFLKTGRANVSASDTNAELLAKIASSYHVSAHADFRKGLESERPDCIVICTPAHTHLSLAQVAVEHGSHVLIEKPLGVALDGLQPLRDALSRNPRFVRVAYVYHMVPALAQARDFLLTGCFGPARHVTVSSGQHFPTFRPAYRDIYYNRHETGGGAIQDALTHLVNSVEWLVGPVTRVRCEAAHQVLEGVAVEDTVAVTARHIDVVASYSLNQFQAPNESTIQIHCAGGSVKIETHEQRWGTYTRGATAWDYHSTPVADRDGLFVAQANAFIDGVEGKPESLCTLDEAVQTMRFNLAALESARTGRTVELG